MTINLRHPLMGFCLAGEPEKPGDIWKPKEGSIQQFDSPKKLYAPDGSAIPHDEIPFVVFRK